MTTIDSMTESQIERLRAEANDADDEKMVRACDRALAGDDYARETCCRAIRAAQAQDDSDEST